MKDHKIKWFLHYLDDDAGYRVLKGKETSEAEAARVLWDLSRKYGLKAFRAYFIDKTKKIVEVSTISGKVHRV